MVSRKGVEPQSAGNLELPLQHTLDEVPDQGYNTCTTRIDLQGGT